MRIISKTNIEILKNKGTSIDIPRGVNGTVRCVTNSNDVKLTFPVSELKGDGWVYMCDFPGYAEGVICGRNQLEFL